MALLASYLPARRATLVDPIVALRRDWPRRIDLAHSGDSGMLLRHATGPRCAGSGRADWLCCPAWTDMPVLAFLLLLASMSAGQLGSSAFAQSAAAQVSVTTPVSTATAPPPGDADEPSAIHLGPLRLTGYLQADGLFGLGEHDHATFDHGPLDSFRVKRARMVVNGDIVSGVGWTVGVDLVQSPVLLDAYITMRQFPVANIRIGQFLAPYSLERLTSESRNLAYERILDRFVPGRDIGIMVFSPAPVWKGLAYAAAVVNGAGLNVRDNNAAKDWIGRITWKVPAIAGVTIAANAQSGEEPTGRRTRVGADIAVDNEHYHIAAEWQRQTQANLLGMPGTGSYLMVARRFRPDAPRPDFYMAELVGRIFAVRDSTNPLLGPPGTTTHGEWEVGVNYYFAKSVKATAHFLTPIARQAGAPRTTFATRLQVVF